MDGSQRITHIWLIISLFKSDVSHLALYFYVNTVIGFFPWLNTGV